MQSYGTKQFWFLDVLNEIDSLRVEIHWGLFLQVAPNYPRQSSYSSCASCQTGK